MCEIYNKNITKMKEKPFVIVTICHHLASRDLLPSMYFLTIGIYYTVNQSKHV